VLFLLYDSWDDPVLVGFMLDLWRLHPSPKRSKNQEMIKWINHPIELEMGNEWKSNGTTNKISSGMGFRVGFLTNQLAWNICETLGNLRTLSESGFHGKTQGFPHGGHDLILQ